MLAVLKAGGMCVPMEPGTPPERVESILRQIRRFNRGRRGMAGGRRTSRTDFRPVEVPPEQAAYVVFTSGTTGEPKGVIGTHAAVAAYADDHLDNVLRPAAARLGRPLRIAHAWSFAFDAAWQPLVALLGGHGVHIVDEPTQTDAEALVAAIAEHGIDMIDTTPSMFAQLDGTRFADARFRWRCWRWAVKRSATCLGPHPAPSARAREWRPTTATAPRKPRSRRWWPPSRA